MDHLNWVSQVLWIIDSVPYAMACTKQGTGLNVESFLNRFNHFLKHQEEVFVYSFSEVCLVFAIRE